MASKLKNIILAVLSICLVVFQLYTTVFGGLPEMQQRAVHLGFVIVFVFMLYPSSKTVKPLRILDVILGGAGLMSIIYLVTNFRQIIRRGAMANQTDILFGVILLLVIWEGTRRCTGWALPILSALFVVYARFGTIFPGVFAHPNFKISRLVEHLYLSMEGVFGVALSVSASFLYLFVLFGCFLSETGASELFMDFGLAIAGKRVGGQAKVAVVASALLGTVSGSSPANVATTGAFTIPLMKRSGYSPEFSGAVESVASTGGQIMPPIMGVAAFIMAEYIGVSYFKVAGAAIIPALLYYTACWAQIHFHSAKIGLKGMDASEIPDLKTILLRKGHMFLPLIGLIVMIVVGYSPIYSAFFAIIATFLLSFLRKETRLSPKKLLHIVVETAKSVAPISITTALVGIIVGIISLTGTALLLGNSIISIANNNLLLVLLFTMLISLVLGMGLPTSAVYIIAATFAAPVIVRLGVPLINAHMFVFYFGCLSSVTPPVAIASIVAAGIAGSSVSKTGWLAGRLAIAGFIVPFMFVYAPGLLLESDTIWGILIPAVSAFIGVVCLGAAIENYLFGDLLLLERLALFVGSILLIIPEGITDVFGYALIVVFIASNYRRSHRVAKEPA